MNASIESNASIEAPGGGATDPYARTIFITGSDDRFFHLACELLASIEQHRPGPITLGFYDLGLTDAQRDWLRDRNIITVKPQTRLALGADGQDWGEKMGILSRPFLRENFPGFSVYIWLDADTWLQDWSGVKALHDGAVATGAAFVRQDDRSYYNRPWLVGWQLKHFVLGYGLMGLWLNSRKHINAGVFALRDDAPHWACWHRRYQRVFDRTRLAGPHDQFSLNATVYLDRLPTTFVPATSNWICDLSAPMWNSELGKYCVPYAPYEPISVLHLAGPAKTNVYDITATDGTSRHGLLRFAQGGQMQTVAG